MSPRKNNIPTILISLLALGCLVGGTVWFYHKTPAPSRVVEAPSYEMPRQQTGTHDQDMSQPSSHVAEAGFNLGHLIDYLIGDWCRAAIVSKCVFIAVGVVLFIAGRRAFLRRNKQRILQHFREEIGCGMLPLDVYDASDYTLFEETIEQTLHPHALCFVKAFDKVHMRIYNQKVTQVNQKFECPSSSAPISKIKKIQSRADIVSISFGPVWLSLIQDLDRVLQHGNDLTNKQVDRFNNTIFLLLNVNNLLQDLKRISNFHSSPHWFLVNLGGLLSGFLQGAGYVFRVKNNDVSHYFDETNALFFDQLSFRYPSFDIPKLPTVYLNHISRAIKGKKEGTKAYIKMVADVGRKVFLAPKDKNQKDIESFVHLVLSGAHSKRDMFLKIKISTGHNFNSVADCYGEEVLQSFWWALHQSHPVRRRERLNLDAPIFKQLNQFHWNFFVKKIPELNVKIEAYNHQHRDKPLDTIQVLPKNQGTHHYIVTLFFRDLKESLDKLLKENNLNHKNIGSFNQAIKALSILHSRDLKLQTVVLGNHDYLPFFRNVCDLAEIDDRKGENKPNKDISEKFLVSLSPPTPLLSIYVKTVFGSFKNLDIVADRYCERYHKEVRAMIKDKAPYDRTEWLKVLNQDPLRKTLCAGLKSIFYLWPILIFHQSFARYKDQDKNSLSALLSKFDGVNYLPLRKALNTIHARIFKEEVNKLNKQIESRNTSISTKEVSIPKINAKGIIQEQPAPLRSIWLFFLCRIIPCDWEGQLIKKRVEELSRIVCDLNEDLKMMALALKAYDIISPKISPAAFFSEVGNGNFSGRKFFQGMKKTQQISNKCYEEYASPEKMFSIQGASKCFLRYLIELRKASDGNRTHFLANETSKYINEISNFDIDDPVQGNQKAFVELVSTGVILPKNENSPPPSQPSIPPISNDELELKEDAESDSDSE